MAGYTRQSAADIVPTAVVRAAPINNELNALRDAFLLASGHKHDGTAAEGHYVPLIGDADAKNKVSVDTGNNRVGVFVEVSTVSTEQIRIQDGAIVPVTDNDIDLGTASLEFKDLFIDGTANIDSLVADTADINGGTLDNVTIGGAVAAGATFTTVTVNSSATIASVDINGGTIDDTVIGAATAQAITGTLITASSGFSGPLTGAVTGNVTGNLTGNVTGNVTGDLTGNVTANSGTSTFTNVTITGTLDMDGATSATIINLASPTNNNDAATKKYVDDAAALKLNLSGGTMSGAIAMGTNKITGLGTPTDSADAATKGYVDTQVSNLIDSAPGALDTLNELAAALGDDANFSTTVTNSLAGKLDLSGGTMTGAIAMGTNKITGMGDPASNQDAATKKYVDDADNLKLNLSGGTMTGAIAMGTNKITGLGDPSSTQDAATKSYVDTQRDTRLALAGGTMTGAIAMGTNKITGLGDPTSNQDAVTLIYVTTLYGSTASAATSAAAAAISESNAAGSASAAATSANDADYFATLAGGFATSAETAYDSFDDRYLGAKASPPTLDNDGNALITGALYFDTSSNLMKVYTGSSWVNAGSSVNGTSERNLYTATASQTTFSATYDVGFVDVYLNGVKLVAGTDFTATDGTSVVLSTGATAGDIVDIIAYGSFDIANTYTQAQSDARFLQLTGGTMSGNITFNAGQTIPLGTVSGTLAVANGGTGITSFGTGIATFLGTPSSANLASAITDETGSGALVFGTTPVVTGLREKSTAVSASDIDLSAGNYFTKTISGTTTFTVSNVASSGDVSAFILILTNGGSATVNWFSGVTWAAGTAPTLTASGVDIIGFFTINGGTTWRGLVLGLDVKAP